MRRNQAARLWSASCPTRTALDAAALSFPLMVAQGRWDLGGERARRVRSRPDGGCVVWMVCPQSGETMWAGPEHAT